MNTEVDQAIELIINAESGFVLELPCPNKKQAQSEKIKIWRKLKLYKDQTGTDHRVMISIDENKRGFTLVLTKLPPAQGFIVRTPDGKKTPLSSLVIDPSRERLIRSMVKDGMPRAEILNYFDPVKDQEGWSEKEKSLIEELFSRL